MIRFALFTALSLFSSYSFSDIPLTAPVKVPTTYNTLYIPGGFDSNDLVQIVGEGSFKNTCYRAADTSVQIDEDSKTVYIGPAAYQYSGLCAMIVLPFDHVIDIGILSPGEWHVIQTTDGADLGVLPIREATTNNPDDYLYAPISQAFLQQEGLKNEVLLTGNFPNSCMVFDHPLVTVEPKVIAVQPIAKMLDRTDCQDGSFPFSQTVEVDFVPPGRYLLHVRSMNGKAVNTLVDINPHQLVP